MTLHQGNVAAVGSGCRSNSAFGAIGPRRGVRDGQRARTISGRCTRIRPAPPSTGGTAVAVVRRPLLRRPGTAVVSIGRQTPKLQCNRMVSASVENRNPGFPGFGAEAHSAMPPAPDSGRVPRHPTPESRSLPSALAEALSSGCRRDSLTRHAHRRQAPAQRARRKRRLRPTLGRQPGIARDDVLAGDRGRSGVPQQHS